MGMFDLINGEQVKCFPSLYLYNNEMDYSYGSLLSLNTGDSIPKNLRQTLFYYYPKDFIILDVYSDDEEKVCLHIIKNYKIVNTIYDLDELESVQDTSFYDYFGMPLNIKTKGELLFYIADFKKYWEYKKNLIQYYLKNLKNQGKSNELKTHLDFLEYSILNKYQIPNYRFYHKIGSYLHCIYSPTCKNTSLEDLKSFREKVKVFFKNECKLEIDLESSLNNSILLAYKDYFHIEDKLFFEILKTLQEILNN